MNLTDLFENKKEIKNRNPIAQELRANPQFKAKTEIDKKKEVKKGYQKHKSKVEEASGYQGQSEPTYHIFKNADIKKIVDIIKAKNLRAYPEKTADGVKVHTFDLDRSAVAKELGINETMDSEYKEVKAILDKHGITKADDIELGTLAYEELFGYYMDSGEMPYGVMKARTGMPDEWIANRLDDLGLVEENNMSTGTVGYGKKGKTRRATGIDDNPYNHNEGEDHPALVNAALWNMKDIYQTIMAGEEVSEDDMFSYGDVLQYLDMSGIPGYDFYEDFIDTVSTAVSQAQPGGFAGQGDAVLVDKKFAPKIKTLYQQFKAATANIKGIKEDSNNVYGYTWNCKKCGTENEFSMSPQDAQKYIQDWEREYEDEIRPDQKPGDAGEAALIDALDQGEDSGFHYGSKCVKCGTEAKDPYNEDVNEDLDDEARNFIDYIQDQGYKILSQGAGPKGISIEYQDREGGVHQVDFKDGKTFKEQDDVPTQKGRDAKHDVLTPRAKNKVLKQIKHDANKQRRADSKKAVTSVEVENESIKKTDYDNMLNVANRNKDNDIARMQKLAGIVPMQMQEDYAKMTHDLISKLIGDGKSDEEIQARTGETGKRIEAIRKSIEDDAMDRAQQGYKLARDEEPVEATQDLARGLNSVKPSVDTTMSPQLTAKGFDAIAKGDRLTPTQIKAVEPYVSKLSKAISNPQTAGAVKTAFNKVR